MISWSWPHMSWWPPLILFICISIQSTPLHNLQDTLTLFYTSYEPSSQISHQCPSRRGNLQRQCPGQKPLSFLWRNESLRTLGLWCSWSCLLPHHCQSQLAIWWDWRNCCPELVLISGVGLGIWSSPHVELCSLPPLDFWEVMWILLMCRQLGKSLGEWFHFPFGEMVKPAKECPNKGAPSRGMLGMEKTGKWGVTSGGVRTQMDLELVRHKAQAQGSGAGLRYNGDSCILLSGCGCSLTYIAEGHHHGNTPGQQLNGLCWAHLGQHLLESGISFVNHLCPTPWVPPGLFGLVMLTFCSQFLSLLDDLTFQLGPGSIGFPQKLQGRVIPQPFCLSTGRMTA